MIHNNIKQAVVLTNNTALILCTSRTRTLMQLSLHQNKLILICSSILFVRSMIRLGVLLSSFNFQL